MTTRGGMLLWVLVAGDMLVLLVFVMAGQREHELATADNPLLGAALTAGEFMAAWLAAVWWFGAFHRDELPSRQAFMRRSLNAWLVAAPLGTFLRALVLGRADIPTAFLVVVLLLGGAMLLGWRLIYAIVFIVRRADTRSAAHSRP